MIALPELSPSRSPCSQSERGAARSLSASLGRLGLQASIESLRAATSPSWVPLLRALLRVWSVALIAAQRPVPALVLACVSIVAGQPSIAALVRKLPVLGSTSQNVIARVRGTETNAKPVVVVAHIDTHPVAGAPMGRTHAVMGAVLGWLALVAAVANRPATAEWRAAIALVAVEALVTLVWLARRELTLINEMPDDNTSGLLALVSVASLVCDHQPSRDVWILGSGAATSGGHGMTAFLAQHREARDAWVVEIDALGAGEVVASPHHARFPRPGTPSQLVRAIVAASQMTGDPLDVRRIRRAHSDARAALRSRAAAITLTGGLRPPAAEPPPDAANAERAARIVESFARAVGETG